MAERCSSTEPNDPELIVNLTNVEARLERLSRASWYSIGILLKVPNRKLKEFEENYPKNVARCFSEVINYWISNGEEVTWKVLWEALCSETVAEANLGREIRGWYTKKTLKDPRLDGNEKRLWTYIQNPGGNRKKLETVMYNVGDTGLPEPKSPSERYYRVKPVEMQAQPPPNKIYSGHLDHMKSQFGNYLKVIEPEQKRFKVGYEARFGQLYWILSDKSERLERDVSYFTKCKPQRFSTHVHDTCDIGKLVSDKCHPPSKEHESWLVDPLKFKMDLPAHKDITYIAVISMKPDFTFVLHEVYQMQDKALNPAFNVVQPRRKYDIRLGGCCALCHTSDDKNVKLAADEITRSIHKRPDGSLAMKLVGDNFHVTFFRHKKQTIYRWKGKEKEKWYLAEYDVDTFEMTDQLHKTLKKDVVQVEFNGGHKKELELWSRKIFPAGYSSSHPTARMYIAPEATGPVRMPNTDEKPATTWKAEELLEDFDEFVQAAFDITKYLENA